MTATVSSREEAGSGVCVILKIYILQHEKKMCEISRDTRARSSHSLRLAAALRSSTKALRPMSGTSLVSSKSLLCSSPLKASSRSALSNSTRLASSLTFRKTYHVDNRCKVLYLGLCFKNLSFDNLCPTPCMMT